MTRNEFLKICGILGIGLPFQSALTSCGDDDINNASFTGKVIIIGAGAGGLSAGYLLKQRGIDFEILEASANFGGRMKINKGFADFPLPLGAEWLHAGTNEFQKIVNDSSIPLDVNTIGYNSETDTYALWKNGQLILSELDDADIKFVNYSWFNFYEEYIVPSISNKILYNEIVRSVNYSGSQIMIDTQNGQFTADKVIIAVPLKILQDGDIDFLPPLPAEKLNAINNTLIWDGFKAFFEFSEKFYDTQTGFDISPASDGQKLYYDAAYGQNTSRNILGLFAVGKPAEDYISRTGDDLRDFILNELDEIYPAKASGSYIEHITQNWNDEPFIKAGYMTDEADWRLVRELGQPVADKLYFAGGAYTDGEDWVSVHVAAKSASDAVKALI